MCEKLGYGSKLGTNFRIHNNDYTGYLRMERFILAREGLTVPGGHLALLDAALAPDNDLGPGLLLQGLERVAARPNDEPDEVDLRVAVLRDQHLVRHAHLDGPANTQNDKNINMTAKKFKN